MRIGLAAAAVVAGLALATTAEARSSHSGVPHYSSGSSHHSPTSSHYSSSHNSSGHAAHGHAKADSGVKRDSHGHIARSEQSKDEFRKSHPCPATGKTRGSCPGYVIDHKQALKHGGADTPSNMQWQTEAEAEAKDMWE